MTEQLSVLEKLRVARIIMDAAMSLKEQPPSLEPDKDSLQLPVRQQDGTYVTLQVKNTKTNQLLKNWLFHHDR